MTRRNSQRGSAMLVTLIVVSSLLAGAAVVVSMQLSATTSTGLTKNGLSSLYCAEAGLAAARPTVANNYGLWNSTLTNDPTGQTQPAWLSNTAFSHDLDGDGVDDFTVSIKDNDDEIAPVANNPAVDTDTRIFIMS